MSQRLDIYVHFDFGDRTDPKLDHILVQLAALAAGERQIMASEKDLQGSLDTIVTEVAGVAAKQAALAQTIVELQAQVAAGSPVSQTQLDGLAAQAQTIADQLAPLATATPPPAPAPTPDPTPDPTPAPATTAKAKK